MARAKHDEYPSRTSLIQQMVLLSYEEVIKTRENATGLHKIFILYHKLSSLASRWSNLYDISASNITMTKYGLTPNLASSYGVMWDFIVIFQLFLLLV